MNGRVVLVETAIAGNLGSVARVMHNLGFNELVLVTPFADLDSRDARRLATHGEPILDAARIVPTLRHAIADCLLVVGASARTGGMLRRQVVGTPRDILPLITPTLALGPVALVFGPEASGLTNDDILLCHYLLRVPTDERNPSLNLSHAVAICLYELRLAWLHTEKNPRAAESVAWTESSPTPRQTLASVAEQDRVFGDLGDALGALGYLKGERGETLLYALRHLIARAGPSRMEINLLQGLARQIHWYIEHSNLLPPPS